MLLSAGVSQLIIVDVQERLAPAMTTQEETIGNAVRLVTAARQLGAPITITQQYPIGIGATVPVVLDAAGADAVVLNKVHFSCVRDAALAERFMHLRDRAGRKQAIVCGMEAHVCVLQTALDLQAKGFGVAVVVDAVSSRAQLSKDMALRRLEQAGVSLVTTEMVIFEWLERAGTAEFKALMHLVK